MRGRSTYMLESRRYLIHWCRCLVPIQFQPPTSPHLSSIGGCWLNTCTCRLSSLVRSQRPKYIKKSPLRVIAYDLISWYTNNQSIHKLFLVTSFYSPVPSNPVPNPLHKNPSLVIKIPIVVKRQVRRGKHKMPIAIGRPLPLYHLVYADNRPQLSQPGSPSILRALYSLISVFSTIAVKLVTSSDIPPRSSISLVPILDPSSFHRAV